MYVHSLKRRCGSGSQRRVFLSGPGLNSFQRFLGGQARLEPDQLNVLVPTSSFCFWRAELGCWNVAVPEPGTQAAGAFPPPSTTRMVPGDAPTGNRRGTVGEPAELAARCLSCLNPPRVGSVPVFDPG